MNVYEKKKWIRKIGQENNSKVRVIFLPHAGGSASFFYELCSYLNPTIECIAIQYPGRQDRLDEDMIGNIDDYADLITEAIEDLEDKPTILFGHSMGSIIAYNMLSRNKEKLGFVKFLLVSAHNPPNKYIDYDSDSLEDDAIIDYLKEIGGLDEIILSNNDMMKVILPTVKNDLKAVKSFFINNPLQIEVPVCAIIGSEDKYTDMISVGEWGYLTNKWFDIRELIGGHFYMLDNWGKLSEIIFECLNKLD